MTLPVGKTLKIVSVRDSMIDVEFNGSVITIPTSQTNYEVLYNQEKLREEESNKRKKQEEIIRNEIIEKERKDELNAIGYKGINLGLKIEKFEDFINRTIWSIRYSTVLHGI